MPPIRLARKKHEKTAPPPPWQLFLNLEVVTGPPPKSVGKHLPPLWIRFYPRNELFTSVYPSAMLGFIFSS